MFLMDIHPVDMADIILESRFLTDSIFKTGIFNEDMLHPVGASKDILTLRTEPKKIYFGTKMY